MGIFDSLNAAVQQSAVGKFFELEARGTKFTQEFQGGTATFLTMAYILAVNPMILADSGGPCTGDPFSAEYELCLEEIKRQYVTATALASMFGCFLMGITANLPIALSCGMGMNAYFTYNVVGFRGFGNISYQTALTAVIIEGFIFLLLSVTGARYAIVKLIPESIRLATPAAIGCFLAHLGLQTAEGIGLVVSDTATAVTLGGCPEDKRSLIVSFTEDCQNDTSMCVPGGAYTCDDLGGIMSSPTAWVGILGMLIMAALLSYKKNYAFIAGIGFVTFISWFRNTAITYFPDTALGDIKFDYFQKIASIESMDLITWQFSSDLSQSKDVFIALITFLYVDFLDTSGTLLALVYSLDMVDESGDFPKSRQAFASDAVATIFGSIFGLSPVTSYIESAAGVQAGARTGLAAVIVGCYFFLSIFFAPIISSIPAWATGGSLIIVGALMCRCLVKIKWHDPAHAIPAFATIIMMPLTYSIAYGIITGLFIHVCLQIVFKLLSLLDIERPSYEAIKAEVVEKVIDEEIPAAEEVVIKDP